MSLVRALWSVVLAGLISGVGQGPGALAAGQPAPLRLSVELLEQSECLVNDDEYLVSFEMRTSYVNDGRVPVTVDLGGERVVQAAFMSEDESRPAVRLALPAGMSTPSAGHRPRIVTIQPGWAVSGRVVMSAPLTTRAWPDRHHLVPGYYTARFDVGIQVADATDAVRNQSFRVQTPPLAIATRDPRQVQECGSFSVPLPPAP